MRWMALAALAIGCRGVAPAAPADELDASIVQVDAPPSPVDAAIDALAIDAPPVADAQPCATRVAGDDGVFVLAGSPARGDTCGSRGAPCATIQEGLDRARRRVYVGPGTYAEAIALHAGITVEGGWTQDWTADCDVLARGRTTIAPPPLAAGVTATELGGAASLVRLTVRASRYGVVATGPTTALTLDDVELDGDVLAWDAMITLVDASVRSIETRGAGIVNRTRTAVRGLVR